MLPALQSLKQMYFECVSHQAQIGPLCSVNSVSDQNSSNRSSKASMGSEEGGNRLEDSFESSNRNSATSMDVGNDSKLTPTKVKLSTNENEIPTQKLNNSPSSSNIKRLKLTTSISSIGEKLQDKALSSPNSPTKVNGKKSSSFDLKVGRSSFATSSVSDEGDHKFALCSRNSELNDECFDKDHDEDNTELRIYQQTYPVFPLYP